ncbi:tail fiber assembly protein [Citrobacter portucalensis]|uniref:tail fiber assembly protein n=1 Tax=Citrobacter portucalensis TaxID=1639133 RepID=UPI001C644293|nr:tail fiber assembly protein [Citrobacter portucalensis]MBW7618136.1 tail fiber assembly protein [Citrobacter portucalensis]MBW7637108.1 tail fiber assembly protein [Citrobacter portucalensis]MCA2131192.1 tail fiber assembly protein [Citrobacter portucalensis]MCA2141371.1 tail fiber assembly protein [Citrobacter portucalensis]MCA2147207.1 tail fiber assembly protein [Citrobacter portucalensis]
MKHFKNFKLYEPDDKELPTALYLRDENGNDWYSVIDNFSLDTFKISYRDDGLIIGCDLDATGMFPVNLSVVEIAPADVPAELFPDGSWFYKDGKLQQIRDYLADAETERNSRMAVVTARITELTEAQDDGDITIAELEELSAMREYRTKLRRLDLTSAPDITWPVPPEI